MSIYSDNIMDHYRNPRNRDCSKCKSNRFSHMHNPSCGDKVLMKIQIDDGSITEICFDGYGCALSTASASILTETLKGKNKDEVLNFTIQELIEILGIPVSPVRMKCASLPLEALKMAVISEVM